MSKQEPNERQESRQPEPKCGFVTKLIKGILYFVLAVVAIWLVWYLAVDREATPVPIADVYEEVDPDKGEIPDYRALYDSLQEKDATPIEDNGWVDVYRAFGPKSTEQMAVAERTKWEDFQEPKEKGAAEVYEKWHKPFCEKFGLDPKEKPAFYDRLELVPYLVKNGIQGDETLPEDVKREDGSVEYIYSYWENAEELPGKISRIEADKECERLRNAPWTPEESPVVAQWLEENKDRFELVAQAVRKPKFHSWHFIPSLDEGTAIETLLPDVQYDRELAREFAMRANLRVGTGDISGAIDDVESIVKLGRHLLDCESGVLVEKLVGLACLGIAASVPLDANISRLPTAEERARIVAMWRDNYGDETRNARIESSQRAEFLLCSAAFADFLELADRGDLKTLSGAIEGVRDWDYPVVAWTVGALPINEPKAHALFRKIWHELMELPRKEREERINELYNSISVSKYFASTQTLALTGIGYLMPAVEAAMEAFKRLDCLARLRVVSQAIWAYYEANGNFPPTFSVDANGAPLHSWRVLILPYLGEKEKALYDQIRLDEPWNSEHNKAFYAQMPDVYRCPTAKDLKEGETVYAALVSQDGLFDRSGVGKDPKPFFQQTDRDVVLQVMLAESGTPFCWMAPDANIDVDQALEVQANIVVDSGAVDEENRNRLCDMIGLTLHSGGCNTVSFGGASRFMGEHEITTKREEALHWLQGIPVAEKEEEEEMATSTQASEDKAEEDAE